MQDIWALIYHGIERALHEIGSELVKAGKRIILDKNILDKRDFYLNTDYNVSGNLNTKMRLQVGSNVAHEQYVLGGKQPSWTPLAPILGWVQRRALSWTDRITGREMSITQIAWMVIRKIKREGIKARNVFADILKDRKSFIIGRLKAIGKA